MYALCVSMSYKQTFSRKHMAIDRHKYTKIENSSVSVVPIEYFYDFSLI